MQSMKNAAASAKETAANVGASAKAGMEKTKAVAQEKVRLSISNATSCIVVSAARLVMNVFFFFLVCSNELVWLWIMVAGGEDDGP